MTNHNSLVAHAKTYYQMVFQDAKWLYGAKQREWAKDLAHLMSVLEDHGMRIPTIDLPAIAKHFDQCLDRGSFKPIRAVLMAPLSRSVRLPKFLGQLYQMIFENDGKLRSDASIDAIVVIRQLLMGLKKLKLACTERNIQNEVQAFMDIEPTLHRPSNNWDDVLPVFDRALSFFQPGTPRDGRGRFRKAPSQELKDALLVLHKVCDINSALFGDLHQERKTETPKHGPGVVSNLKRGEDKYSFPTWNERLEAVFPYSRYAVANEGLLFEDCRNLPWVEHSSRLICVPKTLKGPRLIAAEPLEGQWLQQLVRNQLEQRLLGTPISQCIRFNSQEANQILAVQGSRDGTIATIDLSSASDRLSCWVVERVFRNNRSILERLAAVRTVEVGGELLPRAIKLRKHTTMGSAVTFTVQSICYAQMAIACVLSKHKMVSMSAIRRAAARVQVFGDDIVIPTDKLQLLREMLEYLQLKVNEDKTFGGSNFRESCGVDAFRGHKCQPIYIAHLNTGKVSDGDYSSMVVTSNNLHNAGWWSTAELFTKGLDRKTLPTIPRTSGLFGLTSFTGFTSPAYSRWNRELQKMEYKVRQPIKPSTQVKRDTHASLLQFFIEAPQAEYDWQSGYKKYGRVSLRMGWHSLESETFSVV